MKKVSNVWLIYGAFLVLWGLWIIYDELKKLPSTPEECQECEEKNIEVAPLPGQEDKHV